MSGLDGLGWPNPEDEPKPKKTMNSQLEIKLAPTPETDAMEYCDAMCDPDRVVEADFARKLERERNELREWASVNGVSSLAKDRDQFRARLREEQQLHVQTLNERDEARETCSELVTDSDAITLARTVVRITQERDEARQWESQALVARIQRDQFSKTLGEVREILCDALPNENQLTSFMAATLVRERDEAREQVANLEISLTAAIRSANVCQAEAEKATAGKERLANAIRNAAGVLSCENAGGMARELAAQDSDNTNDING